MLQLNDHIQSHGDGILFVNILRKESAFLPV